MFREVCEVLVPGYTEVVPGMSACQTSTPENVLKSGI